MLGKKSYEDNRFCIFSACMRAFYKAAASLYFMDIAVLRQLLQGLTDGPDTISRFKSSYTVWYFEAVSFISISYSPALLTFFFSIIKEHEALRKPHGQPDFSLTFIFVSCIIQVQKLIRTYYTGRKRFFQPGGLL